MIGTLLDDSRFIRESILQRLHQSFGGLASPSAAQIATMSFGAGALGYAGERRKRAPGIDQALAAHADAGPAYTAWGQAFGNWGHTSSDGNAATLTRNTGGFVAGLDRTLGDPRNDAWRFGLAGGYQRTAIEIGDRSSSGSIDSFHLAAYAAARHDSFALRFGTAYSWHDLATSRTIVFPGFGDATSASYDAHTAQAFGEIGYDVTTWRNIALEPFAGLAVVDVHTDGFTEHGGAASLTGASSNSNTTFSTLGVRAAAPLPGFAGITASGSLAWRHAFGTVTPTTQLAFASGGTPFAIAGVPIARDAAEIEVGLDTQVALQATLGVNYTGQLAAHAQDHAVKAHFILQF